VSQAMQPPPTLHRTLQRAEGPRGIYGEGRAFTWNASRGGDQGLRCTAGGGRQGQEGGADGVHAQALDDVERDDAQPDDLES
jgi:hypothetical protein